jgi:hypothetical protein
LTTRAFARSRNVVFATDVELDAAVQDTYVSVATKNLAQRTKGWKRAKRPRKNN